MPFQPENSAEPSSPGRSPAPSSPSSARPTSENAENTVSPEQARELLRQQSQRLAALDAFLPPEYPLEADPTEPRPDCFPLTSQLGCGEHVAGVSLRSWREPGSLPSLWAPSEVHELFPLLGEHSRAGMDTLLSAWRELLGTVGAADEDSAAQVSWPSRDVAVTKALLEHGLVPLSCLAVRPTRSSQSAEAVSHSAGTPDSAHSPGVGIRRAEVGDTDAIVDLLLLEFDYAVFTGASIARPRARELKRMAVQTRLHAGNPMWLAVSGNSPIGLVEAAWVDTENGTNQPKRHQLPRGRWAYVNCLSVAEEWRNHGVGQALMAHAHREFARAGVHGSYLYYNPPNPLSSVFWPRQGYRPVWTLWEVRPATALR